MDFLKSAVASAISKGPPFPYNFGDRVDVDQSIWTLFNGTRREDGSNCSIFSFDVIANKSRLPLARNAVKRLRTLRHPGVIKVLDTVETDSYIYIATERLIPLRWHIKRKSMSTETMKWGLCSIAQTVKFINTEATSIHGSLRAAAIYTSESGEWRLGGFEVLSSTSDDEATIYNYGSLVPDSARYTPPELAKSGWETIKRNPMTATDSYSYGVLIFEVFNGDFMGPDQAGQTKNIPQPMQASYKRLCNANPKARLSIAEFLAQGQRRGGFFETPLIKLTEGVDNLGMASETEREQFLSSLDGLSDDFPEDYFKMKILPELLKSVEFGGGGPKVFAAIMKISTKLTDEEFDARMTPVIVRLFSSPDRAIRVCLLDNLPLMIEKLPQKIVNDKIFPQMVTGFTDLAPVVREQTVKAVLTIITKLSDRTINGELLKYLAKTANDEQPGIRTNTTICLGKISRNLGVSSRAKVLIAAFTRSIRDPFVHARVASLLALSATLDVFSDDDCANRILPAICPCVLDKEKLVRDQANKCLDLYLSKIRKAASTMADTVLPPPSSTDTSAPAAPRMATQSEGSSWGSWAISSFTNKISAAAGDITANGLATPPIEPTRPSTAPAAEPKRALPATASASALHRQAMASPSINNSARTSTSSNAQDYFADPLDDEDADAWGEMEEDSFFDAEPQPSSSSILSAKTTKAKSVQPQTAVAYDDGGEPDFAGWLAAQSKSQTSKTLPKGLGKPTATKTSTTTRPAVTARTTSSPATNGISSGAGVETKKLTPVVAKKITKAPVTKKVVVKKVEDVVDEDAWDDEGW